MRFIFLAMSLLMVTNIQATENQHLKLDGNTMRTTAKSLLLEAVNGDGNAIGLLYDNVSNGIRYKLHLEQDAVVQGVVSTVKVINDDCRRLKLTLIVPDAKLTGYMGVGEEMLSVWYELNLCKDGKQPESENDDGVESVIQQYYGQ